MKLIVVPELVRLIGRNSLNVLPLLLESLEVIVRLVGLFRRDGHSLYLLNDVLLALQVLLLFLLNLGESFLAFLLDDTHLGLEHLLVLIRNDLVFLRVSTSLKIFLLLLLAFCEMELVECSLQMVYLCLHRCLVATDDFLQAFYDFLFAVVNLLGEVLFRSISLSLSCCLSLYGIIIISLVSLGSLLFRFVFWGCYRRRGIGNSFFLLLLLLNPLVESVVLRVHHLLFSL